MFHLYWAQGQNLRKHVIKKTIQIALLSTEGDPIPKQKNPLHCVSEVMLDWHCFIEDKFAKQTTFFAK